MSEQVLVTGAYGYIASHCILQLLGQGYRVRGSLRKLEEHEPAVRKIVAQAGASNDRLELVQADLLADPGWEQAVQGCTYVLHVASPVGIGVPRSQAERLIRPALDGTLRVMKASARAGVKRVVMTSSLAAVVEGYKDPRRHFDEQDWTQLEGKPRAYAVSKTRAERAAWNFVKSQKPDYPLELAAICPGNVLGPILDPRQTTSTELIMRMMRPAYPGWPRFQWILVDVRDVAAAHLLAMTSPAAAGERFCCYSSILWMDEIARILNNEFTRRGYQVPERILPDALVRLNSFFDPTTRDISPFLGVKWQIAGQKLVEMLGWKPRSMEGVIIDTAESLIRFGLI